MQARRADPQFNGGAHGGVTSAHERDCTSGKRPKHGAAFQQPRSSLCSGVLECLVEALGIKRRENDDENAQAVREDPDLQQPRPPILNVRVLHTHSRPKGVARESASQHARDSTMEHDAQSPQYNEQETHGIEHQRVGHRCRHVCFDGDPMNVRSRRTNQQCR